MTDANIKFVPSTRISFGTSWMSKRGMIEGMTTSMLTISLMPDWTADMGSSLRFLHSQKSRICLDKKIGKPCTSTGSSKRIENLLDRGIKGEN